MQLEHSFTVPADIDTVWAALMDPERVAPCMPGATLTEYAGTTFAGTVKVKVGPISLLYKGSGEFLETDEDTHRATIKAAGKDSRGNGTASATVKVTLTEHGDATEGKVVTDLAITGKPAQFGRGLISEVGGKILTVFADCLARKLGHPVAHTDSPPTAQAPSPPTDAEDSSAAAHPPSPRSTTESTPPKPAPASAQPLPTAGPPTTAPVGATAKPAEAATTTATPTSTPQPEIPEQPAPNRALHAVPEYESAPIDLMEIAGHSLRKRAALPLLIAAALAVVVAILRHRKH